MVISTPQITIDTETQVVLCGNKILQFTDQEFKLLYLLMKHAGKPVPRGKILNYIWHSSTGLKTRIVDVYIGYLRKKLENNCDPKIIKSVRGLGYMITD